VRLPNYRLLDQVSLALERGNQVALSKGQNQSIVGLGALIETRILGCVRPLLNDLLPLFETHDVVEDLKRAETQPLRVIHGSNGTKQWGLLCLSDASVQELAEPLHLFQLETQKALRLQQKANKGKARICGAVGEMVDNIFEHSGALRTGVVAFLGSSETFEVSVGDAGKGILASLQTNPTFAYLRDAGTAMAVAIKDGNSRYGPGMDRGYGFGTLFRALNTLDAEIRFRSGDYALEISGRSPSLRNPYISQKSELHGFVVSVRLAY
jgi:hypothetical protein